MSLDFLFYSNNTEKKSNKVYEYIWHARFACDELHIFCTDDDEHEWIVRTCRKGWDEIVGYQQNPADKFIKPLGDNDIAQTDNTVTTATTATAPPATVSAAT